MNCPLCQSKNLQQIFLKDYTPYYKCLECNFIFAVTETNPNFEGSLINFEVAYLDYFKDKSLDEINFQKLINWILKHKKLKESAILDIGCGSGKLVRFLRKSGYNAFGIEPSLVLYQAFLKDETYFLNCTTEEFQKEFPSSKFDIVTSFDVLEHIKDPSKFIGEIASILKPDSYLFLSTPDVNSLYSRVSGRRWHYFNKYHFSYFSPVTIGNMVVKHNLKVIETRYFGRRYSMFYLLNYIFDFVFRIKTIKAPKFLFRISFPINLFDNMYLIIYKNK